MPTIRNVVKLLNVSHLSPHPRHLLFVIYPLSFLPPPCHLPFVTSLFSCVCRLPFVILYYLQIVSSCLSSLCCDPPLSPSLCRLSIVVLPSPSPLCYLHFCCFSIVMPPSPSPLCYLPFVISPVVVSPLPCPLRHLPFVILPFIVSPLSYPLRHLPFVVSPFVTSLSDSLCQSPSLSVSIDISPFSGLVCRLSFVICCL